MRKRVLCLFLSVLMLVSLAPARTAAADTVFFVAVNEQLLPLNDETMPFWSDGTFYIPSTAVDGTDLGTHFTRSRGKTSAVVYKQRTAITFDLVAGTSETSGGQTFSYGALLRGDTIFLPLDLLCRFFNLDCNYIRVTNGYLVRIKSETVVLSDAQFINAATSLMAQRYAQYERSHAPADENPAETGSESTPPAPVQEPVQARTVYLAVESTDPAYTEQVLSHLSSGQVTLLFTPQSIAASGSLLRRLTANGAVTALRVNASGGPEEALRHIDDANRALWNAANVKTRLVRLDGASEDTVRAVAEAGYCPLRFALDYSGGYPSVSTMSTRIFSAADSAHGSCSVFLGADEAAADLLSSLLSSLRGGNCTPSRLTEVVA